MLKKNDVERVIQKYRFDIIKSIIDKDNEFWQTIKGIRISTLNVVEKKIKSFKCYYVHYTDSYNSNDYCQMDESYPQLSKYQDENNADTIIKETKLDFGYENDNFYINGNTTLDVYSKRDASDIPIVFNTTYETWLDDYEQSELMNNYVENKNIPEWLAIAFFRSVRLGYININSLINDTYFN